MIGFGSGVRAVPAVNAALALLADTGTRGLTHGAVDRHGNLPAGTASNYFRIRDALLAGALSHLADRELAMVAAFADADHGPPTVDALLAEAAGTVRFLLGPGRAQSIARHAIFLEAAWRPDLREALLAATTPFWDVLAHRLQELGAASPADGARTLLACIDGVILDQLIRPQDDFDAGSVLRPVVVALARGRQESPG
jgi:DNA-binding transcriptional regulator YbjK